ncbi:MAG TPA: NYN domain-containing protein [Cyanobacteria bacterium UBA8553]|nr:NYN domain-containing protein [Cyanobacteria bacterium UBA8553]HAJ62126.1 NYN domain-containing protein [Cyanobacteria bacterium UBA8543]
MTDIHLAPDGQTSQQKPLVSLYWDFQNVNSMQKQANLLLAFANSKGRLIDNKVYYNSLSKSQASAKNTLSCLGFNCFDVPCPLKNSADNQLIADGIKDVSKNPSPDIVILVSGDGDFADLVYILRTLGKKVIIVAQTGNVKQRLKEIADEFHFVDALPKLFVDNTQPQISFIQSQITYRDALNCLIEAIKIALSRGNRAELGLIGNLMRRSQRFPNYQGFASIRKDDGTTFSSFSKFVAAAVADKKVRLQTVGKSQELSLVEEDRLAS